MKKKAVVELSSNHTQEVQIQELQAEIVKYHQWCNEWRRLNDGLEEELQRTQFMLMDTQAVISYLEGKLFNQ
jgi:hypothetical protein